MRAADTLAGAGGDAVRAQERLAAPVAPFKDLEGKTYTTRDAIMLATKQTLTQGQSRIEQIHDDIRHRGGLAWICQAARETPSLAAAAIPQPSGFAR